MEVDRRSVAVAAIAVEAVVAVAAHRLAAVEAADAPRSVAVEIAVEVGAAVDVRRSVAVAADALRSVVAAAVVVAVLRSVVVVVAAVLRVVLSRHSRGRRSAAAVARRSGNRFRRSLASRLAAEAVVAIRRPVRSAVSIAGQTTIHRRTARWVTSNRAALVTAAELAFVPRDASRSKARPAARRTIAIRRLDRSSSVAEATT